MLGVVQNPTMTPSDEVMKRVAEEMGVGDTFGMARVAGVLRPGRSQRARRRVGDPFFGGAGPRRRGCLEVGECMTGWSHNAKNTLVKNYLYRLRMRCDRASRDHSGQGAATDRGGYAVDTVRTGAWRPDGQPARSPPNRWYSRRNMGNAATTAQDEGWGLAAEDL
jgi:cholesterol oxidase